MDIHVEARWRDGDMQGGDTLACACLLDLPPLPRGMEFRCFLAGIYARVNPKATSRDRSEDVAGCVRCGFYLNEGVQWLPH